MVENIRQDSPAPRRDSWKPSQRAHDKIQEAMDAGVFDNLPGKGLPLDFSDEDNPFIPDDRRMAYRVLKNAGFSLPWIGERQVIEKDRAAILREIDLGVERLQAQSAAVERIPAYLRTSRRTRVLIECKTTVDRLSRAIAALNRKIDDYNLSVPSTGLQTNRLNEERLLSRFATLGPPSGQK